MTTESAFAPNTAQATAVPLAAPSVHPPRSATGRRPVPLAPRSIRRRGPVAGLIAADALALALTLALMPWPAMVFAPLATLMLALHSYRGLYGARLSPSALTELPPLLVLALIQWYATAEALAAYAPEHTVTWAAITLATATQTTLTCTARALVYRTRRRTAVRRPQSALIVGRGQVAQQVTAALQERPEYGLRPVGRIDASPTNATETLPVLATLEDVSRAVIQNSVRHAVFTHPPEQAPDATALVALLAEHDCRLWQVDGRTPPHHADHLWGFAVRPLHTRLHNPVAHAAKRALDAFVAALALLPAAPVMAACALAVRLADGPGVIFRQERIGRDGRPFTLLKFRTLRPADEHESATRWSVATDRRMSSTGNLLRRTSLDELPQLWNVLRGDMSLVGPRPERPYFVSKFSHAYPGYQARHRMPVGITGLAQVNGLRGDTSIEDRARFDNLYIETWSLWQDVCILMRTAASLFRLGGS
ncbi:exopolysaccharide biosynthesis polyprenyl glycosylphosphotransferase [Streptomyces sp. ISL-96]|uniref:exopolysaccharide biosynthesis polyprenyl glycosylphosphotransferase n=1 Tax=Streptomyces sp. ISL-96 TaxID=2819191 RepID=UPI001BE6F0E5|nr:exopolysaccharide biosynthesis polyprenyl glycosylphosphotransferase [Streptomyces sp. ISL-96]MBT2487429.1 exopolysaccharide biosynthesis polyprenyl glycosylphosphotransferase [Streptomyces sp. ISL-96]